MLGKLLKHEFLSTGRIIGPLYCVALLLAAYILGSYYITRGDASTGQILGITILLLISLCSFMLTAVVMVVNFQRTLYGEQGYLSFTLPVKSVSLLTSKVITSVVWFIIAFACVIGSCAVTGIVIKEDLIGSESYSMIESILPMFLNGMTISTLVTTVFLHLISYLIEFAALTVLLYFSITLANTRHFQRKHILWTIIFILAIVFIYSRITSLITDNVTFGLAVVDNSISLVTPSTNTGSVTSFVDLLGIIISLVFGAAFFYATFYVMSKKVNIR